MYFILDLDDTLAHTTRDLRGDKTRLTNLLLVDGAREFLAQYGNRSILISSAADFAYQKQKIDHLQFGDAFKDIMLVATPEDKKAAIKRAVESLGTAAGEVVIVGDRIEQEIRYANLLGCTTVRLALQEGKYTHLTPQDAHELPTYTVSNFFEFMKLPIFS